MRRSLTIAFSSVFGTAAVSASTPTSEQTFTPVELHADLEAFETILWQSHPDIRHSASADALKRQFSRISRQLDHKMTRAQAWQIFASLNPVLADAHMTVGFADGRSETRGHIGTGGRLFPFEVEVTPAGKLYIKSLLGGGPTPYSGARIRTIDGEAAKRRTASLLSLTPGETAPLRAGLLGYRWPFYHLKIYGDRPDYAFDLEQDGTRRRVRVSGARVLPATMSDESQFNRAFKFEMLPCKSAVLTLNTFVWDDKKQFLNFTKDAFTQIKAKGIENLVIDVRANTGGNDDIWQEGIMPYIATSRYQWASAFKKRVMNPDPAKGEKVGDIIEGPLESWREADLANPLRFTGRTQVLVGRTTYSSTVLFVNVMQAYGFGTIVGEGGFARSKQSGGTRTTDLPNTGLRITWPRFILTPPSGVKGAGFVTPDLIISDDPLRPNAAIDAATKCNAIPQINVSQLSQGLAKLVS